MFRIPTLAELGALFLKQKTVASATSAISGTVKRLEEVANHHLDNADRKSVEAGVLRYDAATLESQAEAHDREAVKALSVHGKLNALLS